VTDAALLALLAIAKSARKKIHRAIASHNSTRGILSAILADMTPVESLMARVLRDSQVLGWLQGGTDILSRIKAPTNTSTNQIEEPPTRQEVTSFRQLEPAQSVKQSVNQSRPPLPPVPMFPPRPADPPSPVRFPAIEKAARHLQTRLAYTPEEFRQLDDDAREVGFTVAKLTSLDAVEKVQRALVGHVANGGTLETFREDIADVVVQTTGLTPARVEGVYRTYTARAYSAGQMDVHDHPLIADAFPYVLYNAIHDGRVRPEHLALEHCGLNGTAVYRADDPVIRKHWPPWEWNCRCVCVFLSVRDAAARGVREAISWLRTGQPPDYPEYVADPGFPLPNGWVPIGGLRPII